MKDIKKIKYSKVALTLFASLLAGVMSVHTANAAKGGGGVVDEPVGDAIYANSYNYVCEDPLNVFEAVEYDGESVLIRGNNFTPDTQVSFGKPDDLGPVLLDVDYLDIMNLKVYLPDDVAPGDYRLVVFGGDTTLQEGRCPGAMVSDGTSTQAEDCNASHGYWKNHPEAWPVGEITIGGITYSQDEAISYMDQIPGDKTTTLFRNVVAAKLTVMRDGFDGTILDVIAAAEAWLAQYPVGSGVPGSSEAWDYGEPLYNQLDYFVNNGCNDSSFVIDCECDEFITTLNIILFEGPEPGPQGPQGKIGPQGEQGKVGPGGDQGPQGKDGAQGPQGKVGPGGDQGPQGKVGPGGDQGPQGKVGPGGDQGPQGKIGPGGDQGPQGKVGPGGDQGPQGKVGPGGDQGPQGKIGPGGDQGPQGKIGPGGDQGPQGKVGPGGDQGPQGKIGPGGDQGPQGKVGPGGDQGPQGKVGPGGDQGPQGKIGPGGDQGPQGKVGPGGDQGPQGKIGPGGDQGPQGKVGPGGDQGPQGKDGAQGPQGKVGPGGDQGPQGKIGPGGDQGPQGKVGPGGDQGPQGKVGPGGDQGPQGKIGPGGDQGPQGKIGPGGDQGPQGKVGPGGDQGPQGKIGPGGDQGPQGKVGPGGDQGPQGKVGPGGDQGPQGKIGPGGDQGPQGKVGPGGDQGVQGKLGPQGVQGKLGDQGPQGKDGSQGPQGKIGPEGPPGEICLDFNTRVIVEENCVVGTPGDPMPPGDFRLQACAAQCPDSTMLVGGGCFVAANLFNKLGLIRTIPVTGPGNVPGLWECGVINGSPETTVDGGVSIEAKAICLIVDCVEGPL